MVMVGVKVKNIVWKVYYISSNILEQREVPRWVPIFARNLINPSQNIRHNSFCIFVRKNFWRTKSAASAIRQQEKQKNSLTLCLLYLLKSTRSWKFVHVVWNVQETFVFLLMFIISYVQQIDSILEFLNWQNFWPNKQTQFPKY